MSFGSGPIKVVEKLWGLEEWLANNENYCLKRLILRPGYACSLHFHHIKDETFVVEEGRCLMEIAAESEILEPGNWIRIPPNTTHRFSNHGELLNCVILEVSTHHSDDDCVRIEESKKL